MVGPLGFGPGVGFGLAVGLNVGFGVALGIVWVWFTIGLGRIFGAEYNPQVCYTTQLIKEQLLS